MNDINLRHPARYPGYRRAVPSSFDLEKQRRNRQANRAPDVAVITSHCHGEKATKLHNRRTGTASQAVRRTSSPGICGQASPPLRARRQGRALLRGAAQADRRLNRLRQIPYYRRRNAPGRPHRELDSKSISASAAELLMVSAAGRTSPSSSAQRRAGASPARRKLLRTTKKPRETHQTGLRI